MNVQMLGLLIPVLLGGLALATVGMRRRGATSSEAMVDRMGRFATREELLAVSERPKSKGASRLAQGLDEIVQGGSLAKRMTSLLGRADVRLTVGEFLLIRFVSALGGFALGFFILSARSLALALLVGGGTAFVGYTVPWIYVSLMAKRRMKRFVDQLGDTITLMANSLRAGYSLLQTMDLISRESPDPIAMEFRRVVREVGLGVSTEEAMNNMLGRVPSDDLDFLVTAINIQHEVGGNLAQILSIIGHTIRERVRIKGEIGVLTAQGTISGYVISFLPVGLATIIFLLNPAYMTPMFSWPWICMPIAALTMVVIGFFTMKKITQIEV